MASTEALHLRFCVNDKDTSMRTQQLERNLVERVAMGDLMRRRARDSGSLPALVDFYHNERRTVTYSELNKKVNKLGPR